MKTKLTKLLLIFLSLGCMLGFASCGSKPEMDLKDAEAALEEKDYYVSIDDDYGDIAGVEEMLYARDQHDNYLQILRFDNKKMAKLFLEQMQAEAEATEMQLKSQIKVYEYMIKHYSDETESGQVDDWKEELKDAKEELKVLEGTVYGRKGSTIWAGTKKAIKDSK